MKEKAHDSELVSKDVSETRGSDLQREVTSSQIPDTVRAKQVLRLCQSRRRAESKRQCVTPIPNREGTTEPDSRTTTSTSLLSAS